MKRCALLVLGLYALFMVAIFGPFAFVCLYPQVPYPDVPFKVYGWWPFWAFLGVCLLAQWLLIRTPVEPAKDRPHGRANVIIPIATGGFLAMALLSGAGFSLRFALLGEKDSPAGDLFLYALYGMLPLTWILWTAFFCFLDYRKEPKSVLSRQCRALLAGSLLELLVAVPSHVIVRMRGYCCADVFTFFALCFGIAVMLISFGPAILAIFAARWRKLQPK